MRLGIFGGTFDPPHLGHWLAAVDAAESLALDHIVWVPAARQPLKTGAISAPPEHRLAMTRLAVAAEPRFSVDSLELERGGLSFMVETLGALRERHHGVALFLLLGLDAAISLPKWRDPQAIRDLAEVVVLMRAAEGAALPAGLQAVTTRRVDISATELRARVAAGRSIRGFVADAVADYIAAHGLYQ